MKIRVLLCLILLSFSVSSADVFLKKSNLETISKNLPVLKDVTCKFSQEKTLPSSKIVLKSGGDFKFEKAKGVTFYTTYPVKSTTTYSQREHKQINSIIKAISNKQYSKLEREFEFYFEKPKSEWVLGLKPKSETSASNYLKSIEITGATDISKIVIITKDETKTLIRFFK